MATTGVPPATAQQITAKTPLYVLKYRLPARGRGRKHMTLFIPGPDSTDLSLATKNGSIAAEVSAGEPAVSCTGTLLQVVGPPFTAFAHSFVRGFDVADAGGEIESVVKVGEVDGEVLRSKGRPSKDEERGDVGRVLENYAVRVQAPGVTKRPWIAEEIRNCQDWLGDLAHELHRRGIVNDECVEAIQAQIDPPVALLPAPSGRQASAQQQQSVITASMGPGSFANLPAAPPKAEKMEWDPERKRFRRWNQGLEQWEYLFQGRGGEREWRPQKQEGGKE